MSLVGVPGSAGARWPGLEKAPRALREALEAAGLYVVDHGDLLRTRWRPNPERLRPYDLATACGVARSVADRVESVVGDGEIPLVVGGDCTIESGVFSGFLRAGEDPRTCTSTATSICAPRRPTPPASPTRWGWRT